MIQVLKTIKRKAARGATKAYIYAKVALSNCSGEKNVEDGVSLVKIFVIGGIVLGIFVAIFQGPIKDWFDATIGSWFKSGGETRPSI